MPQLTNNIIDKYDNTYDGNDYALYIDNLYEELKIRNLYRCYGCSKINAVDNSKLCHNCCVKYCEECCKTLFNPQNICLHCLDEILGINVNGNQDDNPDDNESGMEEYDDMYKKIEYYELLLEIETYLRLYPVKCRLCSEYDKGLTIDVCGCCLIDESCDILPYLGIGREKQYYQMCTNKCKKHRKI